MTSIRLTALSVLLIAVGVACGTAEAGGPPEIQYGRDICTQCNMIISEAKYATAYELDDGTTLSFDDLGGMVVHMRETGNKPHHAWVHDFESEEWTDAMAAHYVPTLSVSSPMGHSIVAFSGHEQAMAFATDVGGEVIDWKTMIALPVSGGLVGHHHGEMMDDMSDDSMDSSEGSIDHESHSDG